MADVEEIQEKKCEIRNNIAEILGKLSDNEIKEKTGQIENRLFEFANFLEATIVLLYINSKSEVMTGQIIKRCFDYDKIVVLPAFDVKKYEMKLMKVDNFNTDLKPGSRGILEPNANRCKVMPVDSIDIAIIPGIALDEKGERIGSGEGYYDRLIPKLSITTRKVSLAFESQIIQQIPVESHDKNVDIVITEKRIIYKI